MDESNLKEKYWTNKEKYRPLSDIIPLKTPLSLLIEPTNKCNFRCKFCPTGNESLLNEVKRPIGNMPLELFSKIVDDIKQFPDKIERIHLYKDGEPLLHPELPRMIRILKEADICQEISVTSNGALLTEELAISIIESGLDSIRISIEALSNDDYIELTQTKCDYDNIKKKVGILFNTRQKLGSLKPEIYVKTIDFNLSDHDKQKLYADFSKITDDISYDSPMNWDGSQEVDLTFGHTNTNENNSKNPIWKRKVCPKPWYTLAINFNGLVSICCVDWAYYTIVGDLNKEHLKEIWLGERLHEFRKMHAEIKRNNNRACQNCDIFSICQLDKSPEIESTSNLDDLAKENIEKLLLQPTYEQKE